MDSILKWSLIVAVGILVLRFIIAFARKGINGKPITGIMVVTFVLTSIAAGMGMYLVGSIKSTIDEQKMLESREQAIIERLALIREAQIVYQEIHGKYTADWDSLITFIKNGEYPIIQRAEEIITLDYGADSIIVHIDTIGIISAFDRIFKANYSETAVDDGIFQKFFVNSGDQAIKGAKAYSMQNKEGKIFTRDFNNNGIISQLDNVNPGDEINKGQLLITYWEYRFNKNVNLDNLPYVPGYDKEENKKFEIFAAKIPMGAAGLLVDVIEVKNPYPFDRTRKEDHDIKNRRPLRFGSRTDATTSGNWE